MLWVCLLALCLGQSRIQAQLESYTLKIQPGLTLIANQLAQGKNTLNETLKGVPDGSALYKYDNSKSAWVFSSFSAGAGKWLDGDLLTLSPGEGAFLESPTAFTLTLSGTPHVPVLPVSIPEGQFYLLSRQTNEVGAYDDIVGAPPPPGAAVYKWKGSDYEVYRFDPAERGWLPATPLAAVGESVWIAPSAAGVPPRTPVGTGLAVISPALGDNLCAGSSHTITWTGGNPAWNVLISLVDVPSWTVYSIITPSTPNTGSFLWNIPPGIPASTYLIYIQEVSLLTWTYGGKFNLGPCATPPCVPPPSGMALWLPFDETNGFIRANLAAGGNPGVLVNGPAVMSGYVSNSLCFNGLNQSVTVPDYPAINVGAGQDFSIDAWVKRAANSPNSPPSVIVDKRDLNTGIGYSLALSFGNLVFQMNDGSGFTNYRDTGTIPPDDRWHFVALTITRSQTNGGRFYIDGNPTGSFDPTLHPGSLVNAAALQVGASPLGGNMPWLGCIDEVELFRRALLPQEVRALYNAGPSGKCKPDCGASLAVTGPTNKTVECGSSWTFDPPKVSDPACTNLTVQLLSSNSVALQPCGELWTALWQVTGCCNNSLTWTQTVTVVDTTAPVVQCAPGFGTDCSVPWSFTPPTALDACSGTNVTITELNTTTNGRCPYVISRAWLVSDRCGNSTTCTQTVVVGDVTAPLITCAPDKAVECGRPWTFDRPTAVDGCSGADVSVTVLSTVTNGAACSQVITRTWLVTDPCGNTNTCSQTVMVRDTTPAEITCGRDKTVECGSPWTFDAPSAVDACCGTNLTIVVLSTFTNTAGVKCSEPITRTWLVTDCCGNTSTCSQTVTVTDTTGPVFATGCVTNIILVGGNNFTTPIAAAPSPGLLARLTAAGITQFKGLDDCRVNAFFAHTFTNLPRCLTAATLKVRLKPCGDACYNDAMGLSFTSPGGVLQSNSWSRFLGAGNAQPGLNSDNWCGHSTGQVWVLNLAALPQSSGPALNLLPQMSALGYLDFTCQDDTGVDYLELTTTSCCYQPNKTVECGSPWTFDPPSATDACCDTKVSISVVATVTNGLCPKVITRTWQATDCCDNSSFLSQSVTLVDTTPPVVYCPGPITRYVCTNSARVYYHVYAYDGCSGYQPVTCNPPSGSLFPVGTTTVSCTATDACGNVGSCSFTVTVTQQILSASALLGLPDCYQLSTEAAPKSAALLAAHPGFCWKPFDATQVNCAFGASFLGLPRTLSCGVLTLRMKPNCSDISVNDGIAIGLITNGAGGYGVPWSSYIGGGNPAPGLTSATWCGQSGCAQTFSFNLASMPAPGGNLLPLINAQGKLDLYVQDETTVDFARLDYCYCRTLPWWQGYEWELVNAELAVGQNFASVSPLWSLGYQTNFSVKLAPGSTHGIQLGLVPLNLGASAGASLTVSGQSTLDADADAIQLTGDGNGRISFLLNKRRAKTSEAELNLRLGGVIVAHTNRPPIPGTTLLSLMGSAALTKIQATRNGEVYSFALDGANTVLEFPGILADEVDIVLGSPDRSPDNLLVSLNVEVDGLPDLQLASAATEVSGLFPQVAGNGVALATGEQISIGNLGSSGQDGFSVSTAPTNRLALELHVLQNLNGATGSNGFLAGSFTGVVGSEMRDACRFAWTQSGLGWDLDGDFSALGSSALRGLLFNQGRLVATLALTGHPQVPVLPVRFAAQASPQGPGLVFTWPDAQAILLEGAVYAGDELRLLPVNPDLPLTSLTAAQVRVSGLEALTLSFIGQPAPRWLLESPLLTPAGMTIRWAGPAGGLLESAPTALGPWSPVPGQSNGSAVIGSPLTNGVPAQFFRVRGN